MPHSLRLFLVLVAVTATGRPLPQTSVNCTPAIGARLRAQFTPWLATQASAAGFSGLVVVACNGTVVYSEAHGFANRATRDPITIATRFNLGSMNKMWTAIAVAQLVEQQKIDVDAPVGRYLPDLTNAAIRDRVLIRHLLTHTSGLGPYFTRGFLRDRIFTARAADYLPFFIDDAPAFTPGERMQYSNAGFALLGMIVERVSGVSYFDYVQRNILDRAGMSHAALADVRVLTTDMAVPYGTPPGAAEAIDTSSQLEARGGPAGGAYASAADLIAFSRALWSGKLVGMATVKTFTTGQIEMGPGVKYAFGFGDGTLNGWRHVGHNGGAPGVGAEFLSFPDHGVDVVVLTNVDMPLATQVIGRAARIVTGQDLPFTPPVAAAAAFTAAPLDADGWPDSDQGRRVRAFFTALAAGGDDYRRFIEAQMTPLPDRTSTERAAGAAAMRDRFGTLTFRRVVLQARDSLQVLIASEKSGLVRFIFDFETAAPHRIMQIDMKPGDGLDRRR